MVCELHATSLEMVVRQTEVLPQEDVAMRHFREVANGISHLHSLGIIHGDVNPIYN
jgi:serine/threonine protein kinase